MFQADVFGSKRTLESYQKRLLFRRQIAFKSESSFSSWPFCTYPSVCACFFVNSEVIDIFHPLPYFTCKLCVLKGPRTFLFTVKSWLIIKRRLYDFESLVVQRLGTKNSERNYHFHKISFEKTSSRTKADWNSSKKCPNIDTKLFV